MKRPVPLIPFTAFLCALVVAAVWVASAISARHYQSDKRQAEESPRAVISARIEGARGRAKVVVLYAYRGSIALSEYDRALIQVVDPESGVTCYVAYDHAPAIWCLPPAAGEGAK